METSGARKEGGGYKDTEDGTIKEEEGQMGPERRRESGRETKGAGKKKKSERVSSSARKERLLFSVRVVGWLATS